MACADLLLLMLCCAELRSGDVPVEYSGEEQAICCVGLAKPKLNVFLSAIQHILVLATPVEVCRS
jgi:nuclear pore complex protein Nup155